MEGRARGQFYADQAPGGYSQLGNHRPEALLNRRQFIRPRAPSRRGDRCGRPHEGGGRPARRAACRARPQAGERQEGQPLQQHQRRSDEHVGAHHHVQQLLRVRHRQGPAGRARAATSSPSPGPFRRRRVRQAGQVLDSTISSRARRSKSASTAIAASKLVDGDSVGRHSRSANFIKRCEPTPKAKYVGVHDADDPKQMPGQRSDRAATGRTSRGCAWTKRCIR